MFCGNDILYFVNRGSFVFRQIYFLGRQEMRPHVVIGVKMKDSWFTFFGTFPTFWTFAVTAYSSVDQFLRLCNAAIIIVIWKFEKFKYLILNEFQIKVLLTHLHCTFLIFLLFHFERKNERTNERGTKHSAKALLLPTNI